MKRTNYIKKFVVTIVGIFSVLVWILAGVMHLWTVFIVYQAYGLFMGFVSLCFPIVSEVAVGIMAFMDSGFSSPYILGLLSIPVGFVMIFILGGIGAAIESKANRYEA